MLFSPFGTIESSKINNISLSSFENQVIFGSPGLFLGTLSNFPPAPELGTGDAEHKWPGHRAGAKEDEDE